MPRFRDHTPDPENRNRTRCGRALDVVHWTSDPYAATCARCRALAPVRKTRFLAPAATPRPPLYLTNAFWASIDRYADAGGIR